METKKCDGRDFNFLIGKSIKRVIQGKTGSRYSEVDRYLLICSDYTVIEIETNDGCGGCGNGWSSFEDLKKLEKNNNVITNVECKYVKDSWQEDKFTMFVYYEDGTINTLAGDDGYGNGYYGGGFYVTIMEAK